VAPRVRAIVLAAGAGRRFGGGKMLAPLRGRPMLQHVLDTLAEAGIDDPIVVLGADAAAVEPAITWGNATRIVNPAPSRGLASSLQLGWDLAVGATAGPPGPAVREGAADAVLIVLGDQPLLDAAVVRSLLEAPIDPGRPVVAPRYAGSEGRNPVRIEGTAANLVATATGDQGLGPILGARPELVRTIDVDGVNPDVDRREDLEALPG
jgi:molybdenum cofactor cytidylyltransferase